MMLPFYEEISLQGGKRVAVISFTQGISKPYVVRHSGREDIYLRVGSTSQLATREQQARLYALGGMLHTEVMPVPGTSMETLDQAKLQNYIQTVINDPDVPQSRADWQERLLGLGFLVQASTGEVMCTIAGLVLFGIKPRRYLRQAGIRVMVFDGVEKTYQARLDETLDVALLGRIQYDKAGNRTIIEDGLVEKLLSVLRPFIFYESDVLDANSLRRDRGWMYPLNALRELVINACAHRDWTRFVDIEVGVYADRLEIISPGALQNSMTIEKMKAGQRSPRNPIIVEVLRDYGYVDARGMGIRTKVIPQMRAFNGTEPGFEATEDYLKTTLWRS
jgi:ATP-dependent DNA helicase RecG